MHQRLLEGTFVDAAQQETTKSEKLEHELLKAREELNRLRVRAAEAESVISAVKTQLSPLHSALCQLFGEFNRVNVSTSASPSGPRELWQQRIAKAPGPEARILETLLDGGGEMSLTQIRNAARTFNNTSTHLNRLKSKNWIQQTGRGTYALKEG